MSVSDKSKSVSYKSTSNKFISDNSKADQRQNQLVLTITIVSK